MMIFIACADINGVIFDVRHSEPDGLIKAGDTIECLFGVNTAQILSSADVSGLTVILDTDSRKIPVSLHLLPLGEKIAIIGYNSSEPAKTAISQFASAFNDYVNQMRKEFKRAISTREDGSRDQFEEIQKLNNEIINTKRLLEKANLKLKAANDELRTKLVRDALTGLVGRYQYWSEIETAINEKPNLKAVFVFIDIDNFKQINDIYGHATGDAFLVEFARRLMELALPDTIRIRVAGDEFALFMHGLESAEEELFEKIWDELCRKVLNDPVIIDPAVLPVSISAGISVYGTDSLKISELIEYADFAMYRAKKRGKNCWSRFDKGEYDAAKGKIQ